MPDNRFCANSIRDKIHISGYINNGGHLNLERFEIYLKELSKVLYLSYGTLSNYSAESSYCHHIEMDCKL